MTSSSDANLIIYLNNLTPQLNRYLSIVVYAQIFYCYDANLTDAPLKCYGKKTWCRLLTDSEFTFISVVIPSLLMFIFGLMTISSIHQTSRRRIQPLTITTIAQAVIMNKHLEKLKKTDRSLLLMLSIQVILLTLFSLPQAIENLYSNITRFQIRSPLNNAIHNFLLN